MRMLLVNDNPVVAKLTGLSAQKAGVEVNEVYDVEEIEGNGNVDIVFIDNAKLNELPVDELKDVVKAKKYGLIYADENQKSPDFDFYLKKPFLPTEMVDLLSTIKDELVNDNIKSNDSDDVALSLLDDDLSSESLDGLDSKDDLDEDDLDEGNFASFDMLMDHLDDEENDNGLSVEEPDLEFSEEKVEAGEDESEKEDEDIKK